MSLINQDSNTKARKEFIASVPGGVNRAAIAKTREEIKQSNMRRLSRNKFWQGFCGFDGSKY